MTVCGIIPARLASTRYPDKPLALILGIPMIGHVYYRSCMAESLDEVWVATCDEAIRDYVVSIGGRAVMTSDSHERASDRAAEAVVKIEELDGTRVDWAALIQGDEPMIVPAMIDELVRAGLQDEDAEYVNLVERIRSQEEFEDPNTVKIVADRQGYAMYLSREPIPSRKKYAGEVPMWKQLGMILFKRDALLSYAEMEPTPLEMIESVDMDRVLEHGKRLKLVETTVSTKAVDTPEDLQEVERLMRGDPMIRRYGVLARKGAR